VITRDQLQALMGSGAPLIVVDLLYPPSYHAAHIPGAINIPLLEIDNVYGRLDRNATIVVYGFGAGSEDGTPRRAAETLAALGFPDVRIYGGGLMDWSLAGLPMVMGRPIRYIDRFALWLRMKRPGLVLVDVRPPPAYALIHLPGAINIPLPDLDRRASELDKESEIVVYGLDFIDSDSAQAADRLQALGYRRVQDFQGGLNKWLEARLPIQGIAAKP
jgi:rhodanese-related sulfurtransferase